MDLGAALLGLVIAAGIKVAVMTLSAVLLARVYRAANEDALKTLDAPPRLLAWGLGFFFLSELTCGVEVYILTRSSPWFSGAHSLCSAAAAALCAIGLFEYFDRRVLHWSDRSGPCFAVKACGVCTKRSEGACRYRAAFLIGATLWVCLALPAFWADVSRMPADPRPYVLPFESWNRWYDAALVPWLKGFFPSAVFDGEAFYLPGSILFIEFRLFPALGAALGAAAVVQTLRGDEDMGAGLLLASGGVLGYALFEVYVYGMTRDPIVGSLVHELAELLTLVLFAELLRPSPATR